MAMNDRRLVDFGFSVRGIAMLRNVSAMNPVVVRLTNPSVANLAIVVCALEEPATQILPLNVIWLDLNPTSGNYMKFMRRLEKNTGTGGYTHKWQILNSFDEVNIPQEYDLSDQNRIQASVSVAPATQGVLGIARLSYPASSSSSPIVVGTNDPRMSDARNPLPHTHPLPPISSVKTATGIVEIDQSVTPEPGMVLLATSPTTATWSFLNHSNITEA